MSHGFSVMRGAHQKCSRSPQIFEAGGSKVLSIRKKVDNARVTLHHALIEHGWQSQIFSPNAHAHHKIEVGCILVSSAGLTNAIVGDTIGEAAISHFPFKPLQIENSKRARISG